MTAPKQATASNATSERENVVVSRASPGGAAINACRATGTMARTAVRVGSHREYAVTLVQPVDLSNLTVALKGHACVILLYKPLTKQASNDGHAACNGFTADFACFTCRTYLVRLHPL